MKVDMTICRLALIKSVNNKVWVVGAGGIGQAIAQSLSSHYEVTIISCRDLTGKFGGDWIALDYTVEDQVKAYVSDHESPSCLIVTTGLLHDDNHQPEKTITGVESDWLLTSMKMNVLPSLFFLKHLTSKLSNKKSIKAACFSARVSSIADNRLGGWHSYRMTKVALNMLIKNTALEWARRTPHSLAIAYHPGTVSTRLSQPFLSRQDPKKVFSTAQAANYFKTVFDNLNSEMNGKLVDWQGEIIPC